MPDYIRKGEGDVGFAIAIGLAVFVIVACLVGSESAKSNNQKKPQTAQPAAQVQEAPKPNTEKICVKERTVHHEAWTQMMPMMSGKSMIMIPLQHPAYDEQVCDQYEYKEVQS